MDNRILIGFAVFLGLFLSFPFVAQLLRADDAKETKSAVEAAPKPASNLPDVPPLLNAQNMIGTEWRLEWEQYTLKVTIAPNGVCYVTHPLMRSLTGMDYIEGRWGVTYDKAFIEGYLGTNHFRYDLTICGHTIYDIDGIAVQRY